MNWVLRYLFAATLFNALSWSFLIPIWQYPDEQAHFAQVQFTAEIGNVIYSNSDFDTSREVSLSEEVLGTARDEMGNNKFTYHPEAKLVYTGDLYGPQEHEISSLPQSARYEMVKREATVNPPLYYNLAAIVYKLFSWGDLFTRVYAARLLSALIFLCTVFVAYKIGQNIFGKDPILPIALAAIVSAKPMLVFASTGVLPDSLTIFLFSLFILLSLKVLREGLSSQKIFLILATVMLGSATRQHFLITLFMLPIIFLHQLIFNRESRAKIIWMVVVLSALLFGASFFVPALDFIHRLDYPESSRKIPGNPLTNLNYFEHLSWTIKHSVAEVWPWFWGVYKWLSLTLPPVVYQIINRTIPLAIVGLIIKTVIIIKRHEWKNNIWFFFLIFTVGVYFLALTTFDFLYRRNNGFSFGIQGRYFFPIIVPAMALVTAGVSKILELFSPKVTKIGLFILIFLFFIFNDFSLAFVSSSYYQTADLGTFIKHASQYKPELFKGNIILAVIVSTIILQTTFLATFYRYIFKRSEKIYQRSAIARTKSREANC